MTMRNFDPDDEEFQNIGKILDKVVKRAEEDTFRMSKKQIKLIIVGVALVFAVIAFFTLLKIETVEGNEIGVLESWSGGVHQDPLQPKTHFLFPGFSKKLYIYPTSTQVFVMNDVPPKVEKVAEGRDADAYLVQSIEGQDMWISLTLQWRIDPAKVVTIHKTVRDAIEEKLIRPLAMRVVKDEATACKAIDAYSGPGLVKLQQSITKRLMADEFELAKRGIIVENFVIEKIRLDPKYISEIKQKQVAVQATLRAKEQTKAAQAEAEKAEAVAQADLKKRVVEAERDKKVGILEAEMKAQQEILRAEAEKKKLVLEATGNRDAELLKAEGILAVGKAEAEAKKLQLTAWAAPGAEQFVRVEVAKYLADAHKNVTGYLPSDMNIMTLGSNFQNAVEKVVAPMKALEAVTKKR